MEATNHHDAPCSRPDPDKMNRELHLAYLKGLDEKKHTPEYMMFGHIRINGIYWALTALCLLGHGPWTDGFEEWSPLGRDQIIEFVRSCRHPSGGYGGNTGMDAHLLFTLSAVQILTILEAADQLDTESIVNCTYQNVVGLQQADGSFAGDEFGEIDTRFSYCALATLYLLGRLDAIDTEAAITYIGSCKNPDGGYGVFPGAESHAGQIFCCLAALSILGRLPPASDPADPLPEWLVWRQLPCGGLNGRPEKLEDVCYSWWVLSCLALLRPQMDWIDGAKLTEFILSCQDPVSGGFADRPGDMPDVFHTLFGIAGLSLLNHAELGLEPVDPALCMPVKTLNKLRRSTSK